MHSEDHDILVEIKSVLIDVHKKLDKYGETIYGNGKEGLTSKVSKLAELPMTLKNHAANDMWAAGIFITIQLAMLGKLLNIY